MKPILLENQKSTVVAAITVNNSLIKAYENQIVELKEKVYTNTKKITEYSIIEKELKIL